MSKTGTPGEVALNDGLGLAAGAPKPRAWAIFTDSGNARMWTTFQPHIQKLADAEGLEVVSLYDRFAIKQAAAAERERLRAEIAKVRDEFNERFKRDTTGGYKKWEVAAARLDLLLKA